MANYSLGVRPIPDVENGHTFTGDNFVQLYPHTAILSGKSGLTFINCNLTNCDVPADSTFIGRSPSHISHCSHIHPTWIERFALPACVDNCEHVTAIDTITIDGVVVGTIYHYADKAAV
jgi:hypothetical protein